MPAGSSAFNAQLVPVELRNETQFQISPVLVQLLINSSKTLRRMQNAHPDQPTLIIPTIGIKHFKMLISLIIKNPECMSAYQTLTSLNIFSNYCMMKIRNIT